MTGDRRAGAATRAFASLAVLALALLAGVILDPPTVSGASTAPWRLVYANEVEGRRGLDVYFSMANGGLDLWTMRRDGSRKRRLTRSPGLDEYPAPSPDGRLIAYSSHRTGHFEIFLMNRDGTRQRNLTRNAADDQWAAWSPDGRFIAFMSERDGSDDVFVMRADGARPTNVTRTPVLDESHPAWAPDGRLTFTRHAETGPIELWVADASGSDPRRLDTVAEPVFAFDWR